MALSFQVSLVLEGGIDVSGDLLVLFKPGGDSQLLEVDSLWLLLHDHGNGWNSEASALSWVLNECKEDWEELVSVVVSNITESIKSILSERKSAVRGLSLNITDEEGKD